MDAHVIMWLYIVNVQVVVFHSFTKIELVKMDSNQKQNKNK